MEFCKIIESFGKVLNLTVPLMNYQNLLVVLPNVGHVRLSLADWLRPSSLIDRLRISPAATVIFHLRHLPAQRKAYGLKTLGKYSFSVA